MVAAADPLLGTDVGRYRLVRLLGKGGMGRVYAAVHPELGTHVAVKVLAEDAADQPELVERFFAEARAVSKIRHESIVQVLDLVRMPSGRPVIVMELVEGQTLRDVLRAGQAPLGGIVQVMIEVLSALAAAHAIGIVHRDLKPDNIMVTASGRAKVLDFGIAKLAVTMHGQGPRTQTGVLLGTPQYMSPEQVTGGTIDERSDVYSAGIVLFEAIAGKRPFEGSDFELMRAQLETPPPSLRTLRADLPEPLEQVIACALSKQRNLRFASANAMANALHSASASVPPDQWRALTADARMWPRSLTPPVPPRPSQAGDSMMPTRVTDAGPQQSPTVAERPSSRQRRDPDPRQPSRWSRIAIPVIAACAGGGLVAALLVARGGGSRPTATAQVPADAAPIVAVVAVDAAVDAAVVDAAVVETAVVDAPIASLEFVPRDAGAIVKPVKPSPRDAGATTDASDGVVVDSSGTATAVVRDPPADGVKKPPVKAFVVGAGTQDFPPDYNPANLDPVAYMTKARARARAIYDDAEIREWICEVSVFDGRVDLRNSHNCKFELWSRKRGAASIESRDACSLVLTTYATELKVLENVHRDCRSGFKLGGRPQCTTAEVWAKVRETHPKLDRPGHIGWEPGQWKLEAYDVDIGNAFSMTIVDDCK